MQVYSRLFLLLFLIFAGAGCKSIYKSSNFKVVDATENITFPGVYGSPISHHFMVFALAKKNASLSADSFWANEFTDVARIRFSNGDNYTGTVKKGDTILFDLYYFEAMPNQFPEEVRAIEGSSKNEPPVTHKGKLLFRYFSEKGKGVYYSVDSFRKIDNVYAP